MTTTEQKQQVTDWLIALPFRHLIALAVQQKISEYANRTPRYLVETLSEKPDVQLQALEMIEKGVKTHGQSVRSG